MAELRKATIEDIPAIMEIEWKCFLEDSFSKEQFVYLITRSKGDFYVVIQQKQVVAYITLLFHQRTRYLRVYSIAVHPDFQGQRLGQLLMEQSVQTAKAYGADKITLEVKVGNRAAISLYQKNGFTPEGVKPAYYHDGSDALYMQRTL